MNIEKTFNSIYFDSPLDGFRDAELTSFVHVLVQWEMIQSNVRKRGHFSSYCI